MTMHARRARSLAILAETGIWRSNYEPPFLRLLWRLGIDIPPPHFVSFVPMFLLSAAWFGFSFGIVMWILQWQRQGMGGMAAVIAACLVGLFFGLAMASYYARGRRKYRLPEWESL